MGLVAGGVPRALTIRAQKPSSRNPGHIVSGDAERKLSSLPSLQRAESLRMANRQEYPADDPIMLAQEALAACRNDPGKSLVESIARIIDEDLWQKGPSFSDFGQFVVAPVRDGGLGVRSIAAAKLLKCALLQGGYIRMWTAVLLVIMRPPGRPETRNNDEGFQPFYKVSTSRNSQDRALVTLRHHDAEVYEEVCRRNCSISAGAIKAGLKQSPSPRRVFDLEKVPKLNMDDQIFLIRDVFNAVSTLAQACFVGSVFEGVLGTDLQKKWLDAQGKTNAN